jgi:hypothetical protein
MADEQESVAAVEPVVTPAVEPVQEDEPINLQAEAPQAEAEEATAETTEVTEAEEDLEDFEWNGKVLKAPKGLKDGVLMHADYTKKTQEVADRRRELEAYEQQVVQQAKASEEELNARATLVHLDKALKEYEAIDWQQWAATEPIDAQQHWYKYQQMKEQKQATVQDLAAKQYQRTEQAKQETAKRLQETDAYAKKLPGWTPAVGKEIADYAISKGIDMDTLQANITPQFYHILYEARIGAAALQKQSTAPKIQQPPQKPLTVIGAKTNAPTAPKRVEEIDDMEQYAAARKKQMAASGR